MTASRTVASYRIVTPASRRSSKSCNANIPPENHPAHLAFVGPSGSPCFHSDGSVSNPYRIESRSSSSAMPRIIMRPRPLHSGTQKFTIPPVAKPPRQHCFSTNNTRFSWRAAANAAATPATPPPATSTSYSPKSSISSFHLIVSITFPFLSVQVGFSSTASRQQTGIHLCPKGEGSSLGAILFDRLITATPTFGKNRSLCCRDPVRAEHSSLP